VVARLDGTISQLLTGYEGVIWAAERDGRVLGLRASNGHVLQVMHVPAGSRLAIVGGWLAAAHGHSLRMLVLGAEGRSPLPLAPRHHRRLRLCGDPGKYPARGVSAVVAATAPSPGRPRT